MAKVPVGILGATGMVGQWFARCLEDHPWFEIRALAASERSAGRVYGELVRWNADGEMPAAVRRLPVHPVDPGVFSDLGVRVLFSALPADQALVAERALADKGFWVFSNAAAFRMDRLTPILIPEVNAGHIRLVERQPSRKASGGFIVTNANCTTTGLAVALRPLQDLFGIRSVVMSSYQALSGAGYPGVASMDITGNVLPHIQKEEEKVELETKKILGVLAPGGAVRPAAFDVVASCCRVAVRYGHLETVLVGLGKDFDEGRAREALGGFRWELSGRLPTAPRRPVIVRDEPDRPQPRLDCDAGSPERARGMAVTVGRLRKAGRRLRFYLLSHNTVRGAAGASVLNAEYAKKLGYIG
ncbi:MAG: aspartate-semialdehyde dehydrogenase [Euryarchaeota archaeon]|nr:aspartate-semialdehyde dehydrogenase [Euryarchaeota archaeon]